MKLDNKRFHILDEFIRNGIEKNRDTKLTSKTQTPVDFLLEAVLGFLLELFFLGTTGAYVGSSLSSFLLFRSSLNRKIASRLPSYFNLQGL
jgi:hypothetical protein